MDQKNQQKQGEDIINEVKQLNIMREKMIKQTESFQKQLDAIELSLQNQLTKYKQVMNPKFIQVSEKSLEVLKSFLSDQQRIIQNLEKDSENNVDIIQNQMREAEVKLNNALSKSSLAVTLAKIQLQSEKIQTLLEQAQISIENDKRNRQN